MTSIETLSACSRCHSSQLLERAHPRATRPCFLRIRSSFDEVSPKHGLAAGRAKTDWEEPVRVIVASEPQAFSAEVVPVASS